MTKTKPSEMSRSFVPTGHKSRLKRRCSQKVAVGCLDQSLFLLTVLAVVAFPSRAFFSPTLQFSARLVASDPHTRPTYKSLAFLVVSKSRSYSLAAMPASEQERLLLTEPAQTAFITAEMRSFLTSAVERNDGPSGDLTRWEMSLKDKILANLVDSEGNISNEEYLAAKRSMSATTSDGGSGGGGHHEAINLLCNTTADTFNDGFTNQPGLLSALGSAICYFRDSFRTPANLAACERVGLSDYDVAHHITDMYHHRNFRGAYTKTLTPSGTGEIAAREAVGLGVDGDVGIDASTADDNGVVLPEEDDDDECILWSPTTSGVCIHWKSDDEAWRKKRFERIQMEGTKDPRRGGSGGTR